MAIKLKNGLIYFLRERLIGDHGFTPYCKIGLVANDRSTETRIKEHQTGNPRQIVNAESIPTNAVHVLETYLHQWCATDRISGEWFQFGDSEYKSAALEARRITELLFQNELVLKESSELGEVLSVEQERPASSEEKSTYEELIQIYENLQQLEAQKKIVQLRLRVAMGCRPGIQSMVDVIRLELQQTFDSNSFKKSRPDLYAIYLNQQPDSVAGNFKLANQITIRSLSAETKKEINDLGDQVKTLEPDWKLDPLDPVDTEVLNLHETYLEILQTEAPIKLQKDILSARLRVCCGRAEGVKGICAWNRRLQIGSTRFDRKLFESDHPDEFQKFMVEKRGQSRVRYKTYRSLLGSQA